MDLIIEDGQESPEQQHQQQHRQQRAQSAPHLSNLQFIYEVGKCPPNIERMFETFHQSPNGDYRPTYYNPFEIKHRRRTTKQQFRLLEQTFLENPKPSATVRRNLAQKLGMTPRAVQVWFQNRRAKVKAMEGKQQLQQQQQPSPEEATAAEQELPMASGTTSGGSYQVPASPALPASMVSPTASMIQEESSAPSNSNLKRRHSMPNMNGGELPFKQLRDALFGPGGIPLAPPPPPPNAAGYYHHPPHYHHPHHLLHNQQQHQYAEYVEQIDPMLGYNGGHPADYGFYRQGSPTGNSLAIPLDLDQFLQSIIAAPPNGVMDETANNPAEFDHLLLYGHHHNPTPGATDT